MQLTTGPASAASQAAMRAMFEARKHVFIDLLGWDLPVLNERYEVDQYDGADACYLILTDDTGCHLASARLLPTTRPHILGDLFAELCDTPPPRSAQVWEITRFCLDRGLRAAERRHWRDTLILAIVEHALANGINSYVGVAEPGWLDQILKFGWDCRLLGTARSARGMMLGALCIEVRPETPDLLADAGIGGTARPHRREAA